jgi:hydrogenase nickel incorporation protein HypA/HybF
MHELSVTQSILSLALETAQGHGSDRITAIDLVIGELSSIVDDSVQFYFDLLSRGTPAEGARLQFRREPATATCLDCGRQFSVSAPLSHFCPACGGIRLQVTGGREFYVESIEVDDENPAS